MSYQLNQQLLRLIFLCWIVLLVCCTSSKPVNSPLATDVPYPEETAVSPAILNTSPTLIASQTLSPETIEAPGKSDIASIITPTPTNSSIPTAFLPTVTSLPSPTPSLFRGPLIAFDALNSKNGQGVILVFDTSTGLSREYGREQLGGAIVGFDWSQDGCNLFVAIQNSDGVQYMNTDLAGNISDPLSQPIPYVTDEGVRYGWTISPTKEWIAFLLGFGEDEEGFSFGFNDTWVIKNTLGTEIPVALTHNSWTFEPVWSPGGDRIAYTKHDSTGISQLYHSTPDGSDPVQLTHFTEIIDHIKGVRWSPDGRWLTFSVYHDADALAPGESSLWSVANDGQNLRQVELGDFIVRQSPWWSDDSESYSAYVELWAEEISRGFQSGKVIWVNPQNGTITHEFAPTDVKFEHVFPIGGNDVIGFLGSKYTTYEKATGTINQGGDSPFSLTYPRGITPLVGPYEFSGETNCR